MPQASVVQQIQIDHTNTRTVCHLVALLRCNKAISVSGESTRSSLS